MKQSFNRSFEETGSKKDHRITLYFYVSVINLDHLRITYGPGFPEYAMSDLGKKIQLAGFSRKLISRTGSNTFLIRYIEGELSIEEVEKTKRKLGLLAHSTVNYTEVTAYTVLAIGEISTESDLLNIPQIVEFSPPEVTQCAPPINSESWKNNYSQMSCQVLALYQTLKQNLLVLKSIPIANSYHSNHDSCLYYELVLDHLGDKSNELALSRTNALKTIGMAQYLDHCEIHTALRMLEEDHKLKLGVKISKESCCFDFWWASHILFQSPDVSITSRLTIELYETPIAVCQTEAFKSFIMKLKEIGCQIALDNFGTSLCGSEQALLIRPDYIKIDDNFISRAIDDSKSKLVLTSIIKLALSLATIVIVKGVNNAAAARLVKKNKAIYLQGEHFNIDVENKTLKVLQNV